MVRAGAAGGTYFATPSIARPAPRKLLKVALRQFGSQEDNRVQASQIVNVARKYIYISQTLKPPLTPQTLNAGVSCRAASCVGNAVSVHRGLLQGPVLDIYPPLQGR